MGEEKSSFYENIFKKIYEEIFVKIRISSTDIFLCGGASTKNRLSNRDQLRKELTQNKNLSILYPEDLFIEMMNRDKNYDLLSLEKSLADNSDYIFIVCESPGSLVELGAFTNNENTVGKVVAIFDEKRKYDKSFIMLGPVKILKKQGSEHIIFYKDINDLRKKVDSSIYKLNQKNKLALHRKKSLSNLLGLYHFIMITLYYFKEIEVDKLIKGLHYLNNNDVEDKEFNILFRASLRLLYKNKLLKKTVVNSTAIYSLTEKGINEAIKEMYSLNIKGKNKLFDGIKFDILKHDYYFS